MAAARKVSPADHHDALALGAEFGGELTDGGGLAGAVDAGDQDDERLGCHFQRLGHGAEDLFDFTGEHSLHFV